jgi:Ran GTPase-activating protein (RanGAP) involved in mRNA processing and transport
MARKEIKDDSGMLLAKMLNTNTSLRKLELEGNLLGIKSATEFGKALKKNKTLKYLDLESNQLTLDGQEMRGIYDLVEFLDHNTSLLSLNLANN